MTSAPDPEVPSSTARDPRAERAFDGRAGRADGASSLGLHEPLLLGVLLLTLVLQHVAWSTLDGYQIADSVEYIERARTLVRGESMVDSLSIRPLGFSALLLPFFVIGDWLGLPDQRALVWCTYLLQIALGLALVHRVALIGSHLGGRTTGLVAALFVGANPIFLQYSAQAESGIAAALCLALGIERFLERGTRRAHLVGGLWLGAAFLIAYKSLVIVLAVALLLALRDRWKHRRSWVGVASGLAIAMLVQVFIDWAMYGWPGASLVTYLVTNFGSVTYSTLHNVGLTELARPIYEQVLAFQGIEVKAPENAAELGYFGLQSRWWYFEHLPEFLVLPVLLGAALGCLRALRHPGWKPALLLAAFFVFAGSTSNKGSKDFRIWIPVLPAIAPIAAWGLDWALASVLSVRWRRTWRALVLFPAVGLGLAAFLVLPTRRFGAYLRAMERTNALARELHAEHRARARAWSPTCAVESVQVGAAYNWAVYLHDEPGVELVKLPHQLTGWKGFDDAQKARTFATLEELDLFVTHHPILSTHLDLMEWVAAHYEVRELFWDRATQRETGPLYVLSRRAATRSARDDRGARGARGATTFFEVLRGADPEAFRRERALPPSADFVATDGPAGTRERLVLLGYEVVTLPPDGWFWITYHWWTPTGITRDLTLVDRLTALDERNTWQNDHRGAWGAYPTSEWRAGEIVSESYPLVPATTPFAADAPWRPVGGGYRRGDALPVRLWMELVELDPEALQRGERVVRARFELAREGTDEPVPVPSAEMGFATEDGLQFSGDGFVRVGAFFLPVHTLARLPDDGRPVPE